MRGQNRSDHKSTANLHQNFETESSERKLDEDFLLISCDNVGLLLLRVRNTVGSMNHGSPIG